MSQQSYLIFELSHSRYGIPTAVVQELFFLPEITAIPETPACVVGVINLRGEILSIVDLQHRLGQKPLPYQLTDSVIVMQWQNQRVGVLVNQVCEVQTLTADQLQIYSLDEQSSDADFCPLTVGIASLDAMLVTLLNPTSLIQYTSKLAFSSSSANHTTGYSTDYGTSNSTSHSTNPAANNGNSKSQANDRAILGETTTNQPMADPFDHLSSDQRQLLRVRSENLRQTTATQNSVGIPVAVMGLEGEYFGLELGAVHEFTDICNVTPVPCCPPHVIGNMNLRGEILTLVDISQVINLPISPSKSRQKAIVVRLDELVVGIAVDEILDVVYLEPTQISTVPVATHSSSDEYLQGVAPYQNRMMSVINLLKMLTADVLVVNEEV